MITNFANFEAIGMAQRKFTAFVPNLIVGLGIVAAFPLPSFGNPIIIDTFDVTPITSDVFVPIVYYAGGADHPEPGFYHQSILIQKASEKYFQSILFDFKVNESEDVYIYKEYDFEYEWVLQI